MTQPRRSFTRAAFTLGAAERREHRACVRARALEVTRRPIVLHLPTSVSSARPSSRRSRHRSTPVSLRTSTPPRRRLLGWVAAVASTSLVAGTLVAVGFGSAPATAAAPAPGVAVGIPASYLAGEDLAVDITFTSAGPAAGPQYNLSAAVLVPEGVSLVGTGTLGSPIEYPKDPAERVIPGGYAGVGVDCAALGLEPASS